ncbi:MAG: magnesium transporter [Candidatus Eisenbacteria sp.]|nr:magnesium transporter [Candidatus Eisenbacteria bacterium]
MRSELEKTLDQVKWGLELGQTEVLEDLVNLLHPEDVVAVLHSLDEDDRRMVFSLLSLEPLAEVLDEADDALKREILDTLADEKVSSVVETLPSDEAADLVGDLSEDRAASVLARLKTEDSEEVRGLLRYDEESAGGIMETELVSVPENALVAEAIDTIRQAVEEEEDSEIYSVYVVDGDGRLKGAVALSRLLLARPVLPVNEVMESVESVPTGMDQEEVARLVSKYDMIAIPVVDEQNRLVGQVTVDDVVDVIEEEATEDFSKIAGAGGEEVHEPSAVRISSIRLPWLVVGLGGGLVTAWIMSAFEVSLATMISIAFFLPVMTAMAGNAAIQSSAIIIRGLATGEVSHLGLRRRLLKELRIAMITGLACGIVLAVITTLWRDSALLGVLLGLSMMGVMLVATTVGALIPLLLKKMRVDPTIAMGPIVTTWNDITSVIIYLTLATVFLRWLE